MRAFIGILIPESVKDAVMKVEKELDGIGIVGKYVERENLHINLSFLDEITEEESQEIMAKLDMIAKGCRKFNATLAVLKAIPNEKFTRVIALEVNQEKDILNSIVREVKKSIGGDTKPPHVTVCRVKDMEDKQRFLQTLEKYKLTEIASFEIDSIQLIKSELGSEGPVYSVVHESKFG